MDERTRYGVRISYIILIVNIVLSVIKLVAAIVGNSSAAMAEAINTVTDSAATILVIVGLKLSGQKADSDHQYGHEKIEPIISKLLAIFLLLVAAYIGYTAVHGIATGVVYKPDIVVVYTTILSIFVSEWMFWYSITAAKKIDSPSLKADAWHHRTDSLSSLGALIGIVGARLGFYILDPIASIIICGIIAKVAVDIYMQSVNQLIDKSATPEVVDDIRRVILSVDGVAGIDDLKTRVHSSKLFVDAEISIDKSATFEQAHDISECVHVTIEQEIGRVKHCTVHANPKEI